MSWRDDLQPGSFRGVPFLIDASQAQVGRRVSLHQYPLRDTPWGEDLGRFGRQFSIECLVIGADYMTQRDRLIDALETAGPGTLVHPYRGTLRVVVVQPAEISETTREGGLARFRIPFAEAGDKTEPAATADTAAQVQTQASTVSTQLSQSFGNKYSLAGLPQWLSDAATGDLGSLTGKLAALRDSIPGIPTSVTAFNADLQAFSDGLSSLIRTPFNLGASIVSLVLGLGTIARQPLDALGLYTNLLDFGSSSNSSGGSSGSGSLVITTSTATPARQQQATNQAALIALVQGAAVAQAAAAAASVPAQTLPVTSAQLAADPAATDTLGYATAATATAVCDQLTAALDDQALVADDILYPQLMDLRAAVVRDIDTRVAALPALITFTPKQTMPALVLAYRLYADASRNDELVARNDLVYPAFITGGQALEVLSD